MCISHFFLTDNFLLAVYFIFILDYGNDVRQKVNPQAIFLFQFKMDCKAAETTHNINNTFGPGTANKCTMQWWFKKFCKRDKSLDDEKCSVQPSEFDNDHLRGSTKPVLLQLHKKLPKNSMSTILQSFSI